MNKLERQLIWAKATDPNFHWTWDAIQPFCGIGGPQWDGQTRHVTIEQAAASVQFQAQMLNGQWDQEELEQQWWLMQHRCEILDGPLGDGESVDNLLRRQLERALDRIVGLEAELRDQKRLARYWYEAAQKKTGAAA